MTLTTAAPLSMTKNLVASSSPCVMISAPAFTTTRVMDEINTTLVSSGIPSNRGLSRTALAINFTVASSLGTTTMSASVAKVSTATARRFFRARASLARSASKSRSEVVDDWLALLLGAAASGASALCPGRPGSGRPVSGRTGMDWGHPMILLSAERSGYLGTGKAPFGKRTSQGRERRDARSLGLATFARDEVGNTTGSRACVWWRARNSTARCFPRKIL